MQRPASQTFPRAEKFERVPLPEELTPVQADYLDEVIGMLGCQLTDGELDLVLESHRRSLPTIFSVRQIRKARGLPVL